MKKQQRGAEEILSAHTYSLKSLQTCFCISTDQGFESAAGLGFAEDAREQHYPFQAAPVV